MIITNANGQTVKLDVTAEERKWIKTEGRRCWKDFDHDAIVRRFNDTFERHLSVAEFELLMDE